MNGQLCRTAYLINDVNHIPHLELQLVLVLRDVVEEHLALPLLGPWFKGNTKSEDTHQGELVFPTTLCS